MNFVVFVFIISALGVVLILPKLSRARERRKLLIKANRLSSLEGVEKDAERFNRIFVTNFGYGKEVWAITGTTNEVDLKFQAFKNGVLMVPRPDDSSLKKFCLARGITLTRTLVK